jgi:phage shock protein PspC (stress-responsive transcriptional regulator)
VQAVMATMGSVNDFKAAEEQDNAGGQQQRQEYTAPRASISNKKLYRDNRRKILGGVAAGLGHYFNVDPVWPRLLLVLLAFATYGGLVVAYVILWVIIPPSDTLEDESSAKKMYRDSGNRVIGGVAAGLAAFWGIDTTVVRVLFIGMSIFGGLGVVIYIIMWIALPEAKTITEKMQMSGEPVTLSNIESSVKKGLNEKDGTEESVFAKIILFPFRLLAAIIDGIAKVLGPVFLLVVDIFRIGFGLCITLTGAAFIFALVVAFGVVFGLFSVPFDSGWNDWYVTAPNVPIEALRHTFPRWMAILSFIAAFIPALMISLLGTSIIARKIVFNSYVGWSMFVLFFVSIALLSLSIPKVVMSFREDGEYKVEKTFTWTGTPVFKLNETGLDGYHVVDFAIHGHQGKDMKLIQRFEAQGRTRKIASENAQTIEYNVVQRDSIITFDSNITFKENVGFHAQRLEMDLYVPENAPFIMEAGMLDMIDNRWEGRYYSDWDNTQTWRVNEHGTLECLTCMRRDIESRTPVRDEFGLVGFTSLDIQGAFDVTIDQGDEYGVEVDGDARDKDNYRLYVSGETLVIDYEDDRRRFFSRKGWDGHLIDVRISMPTLREIEASGGGKLRFRGFKEDKVRVKLVGAVAANAGIDARNLEVTLTGASSLDLNGTGTWLDAELNGASILSAYGYEVRDANIEANGASSAKVYVTDKLEISRGVAGSVSHRGNPEIVREND